MYREDIHVEIGKYICWRVGIAALRGWYSSGALGGSVKSRHNCEAEARDRHNSTWQQPLLHLCRSTCPLLPLSSHWSTPYCPASLVIWLLPPLASASMMACLRIVEESGPLHGAWQIASHVITVARKIEALYTVCTRYSCNVSRQLHALWQDYEASVKLYFVTLCS